MKKQTIVSLQNNPLCREDIIKEIKRLALLNGSPPGKEKFQKETGISIGQWLGIFWARWSDALVEAGLAPNKFQGPADESALLRRLALAVRHFGYMPTKAELQLYRKNKEPELPNINSIYARFQSKVNLLDLLEKFINDHTEFEDIGKIIADRISIKQDEERPALTSGFVYLIKSGIHYKIGRSDNIERRVKEISIVLPEGLSLVHAIRTDDPTGIEKYWHDRFADRRAKGEWFKLTPSDVKAFKGRKAM